VERQHVEGSDTDHRPWALTVYQLTVVIPTLSFLAVQLTQRSGVLGHPSILVWAAGVAAVDLIPVPAAGGLYLSLSFPILLAAAMIYAPPVAGLLALVGSLDPRELRRSIPVLKALFIRAQIALAVLAGSSVFHALASLRSPWAVLAPAVLAMIVVDSAVNTGLVAGYQHLAVRVPIRRILGQMHVVAPGIFVTSYLLLGMSGVVIARFYLDEGVWAALALVAPLVFARQMFVSGQALHATTTRYRSLTQNMPAIMSRLRTAEEQIRFMAYHDRLTGLPNRNLFEELLDQAMHRARRGGLGVSVLFIDMDNFKLINDSLGHQAGDELLRELAIRLRDAVRESDVVARQGGDEFLVLISDVDLKDSPATAVGTAEAIALRIQECLNEPFSLGNEEFYVTGTIGISMFPLDATAAEDLLRNADGAMYRSKKQGPGGILIHPPTSRNVLAELSFATRLRRAVDTRQWVLHYQPIVDLQTSEVQAVEALIRWKHPDRGLIQPGEFLPLAEAMGFSEAIGDWVLDEAIQQCRLWRQDGFEFEVCMNLSPRQLRRPDMAKKILAAAEAASVPPSSLVIEVTEAAEVGELEQAEAVLRQLRERGLGVAMDDFGTGHSSLARLRGLPADRLKIDRMFVRELPHGKQEMGMVSAIIRLAGTIGMCAIAEGIETQEQLDALKNEGCPLGQGFYFSRPLPAEELSAYLRRAHARSAS
jgi:diguanylate cyclase (GGDEF)-like protein